MTERGLKRAGDALDLPTRTILLATDGLTKELFIGAKPKGEVAALRLPLFARCLRNNLDSTGRDSRHDLKLPGVALLNI
jgi:hypothetical protein